MLDIRAQKWYHIFATIPGLSKGEIKMIEKVSYFTLTCDNCRKKTEQVKTHQEAREKKWAISRDRKHCYCPKCAPWHRVGIPIRV